MNSHLHAHPFSSQMKAKYSQWKTIMGLSSCRVWPLHTNFFWRLFRNLNTWLELLSLVLRRADPTLPTHKVFVLVALMSTDHNCAKLEGCSMLLYLNIGRLFAFVDSQTHTVIIYWKSNVRKWHIVPSFKKCLNNIFPLDISLNILNIQYYFKYNVIFCITPGVWKQYE